MKCLDTRIFHPSSRAKSRREPPRKYIILLRKVAREGIEPPTRGFSAADRVFQGFINQSLTALATPLPRRTKAQSWHTQSELVTFLAQRPRDLNLARPLVRTLYGCYSIPI